MDRRKLLQGMMLSSAGLLIPVSDSLAGIFADEDELVVKDYITKIKNFDHDFSDDIILQGRAYETMISVTKRLRRVQRFVGYANFSLLNMDKAIYFARNYRQIGEFTKGELEFLEALFYTNANDYGFYGEKVLTNLTDQIRKRDVLKVSGSGHYIFRGSPLNLYNKIRRELGSTIVLTSGIRGVVKQTYLFLNKAVEARGNLSRASRSLAPPGYSFHGVGDFDVGKRGYGKLNFTEKFASTSEFKRLKKSGYINIRYPEENPFGVRFEPWHIKVV